MTNKEKYGNEIIDLAVNSGGFCIKNGEPALCEEIKCGECDFCDKSYGACKEHICSFREWLNSEYVEPPVDWSKVAVDTPILVRDSKEEVWERRYFAKYEDNTVYAWGHGSTSWSAYESDDINAWKMAKLAEGESSILKERKR